MRCRTASHRFGYAQQQWRLQCAGWRDGSTEGGSTGASRQGSSDCKPTPSGQGDTRCADNDIETAGYGCRNLATRRAKKHAAGNTAERGIRRHTTDPDGERHGNYGREFRVVPAGTDAGFRQDRARQFCRLHG